MKIYNNYVDSEVYWIDKIPIHWKLVHLKNCVSTKITDGPHDTPVFYDSGVPFLSAESVYNGRLNTISMRGYISEDTDKKYSKKVKPKKNDIFIVKSGSTTGKIGFVDTDEDFNIWSPLALVRINKKFLSRYVFHFLSSTYFQKQIQVSWSLGTQPNIGMGVIEQLQILLPPLPEQQAIADYLDWHTSHIDQKIALLEAKAEKYVELKSSLINETVTHGLDKNVPMKDSGVEWIGQIPSHWAVRRLKEVVDINKKTLAENTPSDYTFEYIDISGVTYGVKGYKTETMAFDSAPSRARRIVKKGDTIVSTVRTYLKAITSIDTDVSDLIVSTGFAVISPKRQIFDKYCSYWLTSNTFIDEVFALSTGVSYPATNASTIGNLFHPIPPITEQKEIAEYLENKTAHIEKIIETIHLEIDKLAELRKTLINDVVTGKIKVVEET